MAEERACKLMIERLQGSPSVYRAMMLASVAIASFVLGVVVSAISSFKQDLIKVDVWLVAMVVFFLLVVLLTAAYQSPSALLAELEVFQAMHEHLEAHNRRERFEKICQRFYDLMK